jgi:hypothetical protein
VVAEDRQRVRGHRARRDVEDGGRQFAGDLEHVGDHQQQALRRGEGGGQRPGLQRAVDRAGGAGLALHLDDLGNAKKLRCYLTAKISASGLAQVDSRGGVVARHAMTCHPRGAESAGLGGVPVQSTAAATTDGPNIVSRMASRTSFLRWDGAPRDRPVPPNTVNLSDTWW